MVWTTAPQLVLRRFLAMNIVVLIVRLLPGQLFFVFGLNAFL